MENYILTITIPGTVRSEPTTIAYPTDTDNRNVINVICGQNNTGKSYLLQSIRQCLQLRWKHTQVSLPQTQKKIIEMDQQNGLHFSDAYVVMKDRSPQPRTLAFGTYWKDIDNAGIIGLNRPYKPVPSDRAPCHEIYSKFAYKNIKHLLGEKCLGDEEKWISDLDYRKEILSNLIPNTHYYRCNVDRHILDLVEEIVGGHLYIVWKHWGSGLLGQIEYAIIYGDGTSRTYQQWSDGQKSILYFLLLINKLKPTILLFDEIENHLHPAYISDVLAFIKANVQQTIIATHHPHVIFSNYVDRVIYIETQKPPLVPAPAPVVMVTNNNIITAQTRNIYSLENALDKLSAIYKLFNHQDQQLLKQAQRILYDSEIMFYRELQQSFVELIAPATNKLIPDSQTGHLAKKIKELITCDSFTATPSILDYGAGHGRTEREYGKISSWQSGQVVRWICWEKNSADRIRLREEISKHKIFAAVPDTFEEIPSMSVDAVVFANVLHHLTPRSFGQCVHGAISKLKRTGVVIVLELYPLLSAEKFAVPYSPDRLTSIFRKLNFLGSSETFNVRESSAYSLCITNRCPDNYDSAPPPAEIESIVQQEWDLILEDSLHRYAQMRGISDFSDYRDITRIHTTIASINAWNKRLWT